MQSCIKISVISATYNCKDTISSCFESYSQQDYWNREHIVIDGASTDGTLDIIKCRIEKIDKFKSEPDSGIYDALNKGIRLATGDVIGFLHADDVYASNNVLSKIARAFQDDSVCAVYGDLQYVNQENLHKLVRNWKGGNFDISKLKWGWMPPHPTLYIRREWYVRIGYFDTNYKIAADYHSILKLFGTPGFKTTYLPEVLVFMRTGGASNRSVKAIVNKSKEDFRALRSSGFSMTQATKALVWKNLQKIGQLLLSS